MDCRFAPLLASEQTEGNEWQHGFYCDDRMQHAGVEVTDSRHGMRECRQGSQRSQSSGTHNCFPDGAHAWLTNAARRKNPVVAMSPPAVRSSLPPTGNKSTRPIRIPVT